MIVVAAAGAAAAQGRSYVEVQTDRQSLDAGYPDQVGALVRGVFDRGRSVWIVDVAPRRAFLDDGVGFGVLGVHQLGTAPWILSAGAAGSAGGFFLPKARADLSLGRKWLTRRQLVTAATARFVEAKDGHRDYAGGGELTWYGTTATLQLSSQLNVSNPGRVVAAYHRAAISMGSPDSQSLTLYGGVGREAYQLLGANAPIANFPSGYFGASWRQWSPRGWGATAGLERYDSDAYGRLGVSAGVMRRLR